VRRRVVPLVVSMLVLTGCAPVHRINPVDSGRECDDLNRALHGRRATVELARGGSQMVPLQLRAESIHGGGIRHR
jgi:hypothetical protein